MAGRFLAIVLGVTLAVSGLLLAAEEARLFESRLALRALAAGAAACSGDPVRCATAEAAFASVRPWRSDAAAARLQVAMSGAGGGLPDDETGGAVPDAAARLAAVSPARGEAWCALAAAGLRQRGFDGRTAAAFEMCHRTAPREVRLAEGRMLLAMIAWERLSPAQQALALAGIASVLEDAGHAPWMAARLAWVSARAMPERRDLIETVVHRYGGKVTSVYAQVRQLYTAGAARPGAVP